MILDLSLIARALPGLRSVSDDAEQLVALLEDALTRQQHVRVRCDAPTASDAVERYGNPTAAARALGIPRSTFRDALRRRAAR